MEELELTIHHELHLITQRPCMEKLETDQFPRLEFGICDSVEVTDSPGHARSPFFIMKIVSAIFIVHACISK